MSSQYLGIEYITFSKIPQKASLDKTTFKNIPAKKCAKCGSLNTVCVFRQSAGSIIGAWSDEEFYCYDCKYFTLYEFEYNT
jgi:hypothetical protein